MVVNQIMRDEVCTRRILNKMQIGTHDVPIQKAVDRCYIDGIGDCIETADDFADGDIRVGNDSDLRAWRQPLSQLGDVLNVVDKPVRLAGTWTGRDAKMMVYVIEDVIGGNSDRGSS